MKIKKITEGVLYSGMYKFEKGILVEVDDKTGKYLIETFKDVFEVVEQPKKEEAHKPKRRGRGATKKDS